MPVSAAANSGTFTVSTPTDCEIEITRVFNAPPALVFEAMTEPEHIRLWWGCLGDGYSVPVCEVDLRVGGKWRFVNRTPKGQLAAFNGEYREIDRPAASSTPRSSRTSPTSRRSSPPCSPRSAARPGCGWCRVTPPERCGIWCCRPVWSAVRRSATTGSKTASRRCQGRQTPARRPEAAADPRNRPPFAEM